VQTSIEGRYRAGVIAAGVAVALALFACSENRPEALVASARDYIAKGDHNSAVIQLRNAVQKAPNDGEVRLLLAGELLQVQDAEGAVKEYRRALELQVAPERVYPSLARALLEANSADKVVAELADKNVADAAAQADLQTSIGQAYLTTGKAKEARSFFAKALAASPGYPNAKLGEARILAVEGKTAEAGKLVDEVLASSPNEPEGLFLKGELLRESGRTDEAIAAFEQVIKARPRTVTARRELASLLMQKKEYDQAASQIETVRKIAPRDPQVLYLDAQMALHRGQMAEARNGIQQLLKVSPDNVPGLILGGRIELDSGSYAIAEQYLRKALSNAPRAAPARQLLVTLYLQTGQPTRALETLQPLLAKSDLDAATLVLAGEVYFANRDLKTATAYLEKAASLGTQSASVQTRLAQVRLASGDVDRAMKDLQAISKAEPDQIQADVTLVTAWMQRKEFDKAFDAARVLEQKQPGNPLSFQLLGAVFLAKDDVKSARAAFEKALTLQSSYLPSLQALARLDLQDANAAAGRKRYEAALAKDPENAALLIAFAAYLRAIGAEQREAGALLERALQAAPDAAEPRVALAEFYLRSGDATRALDVAQQANVIIPNDPRIVEVLGMAQQATGNSGQAIETYRQLVVLLPQSANAQVRLARAHAAVKEYPRALQLLRSALAREPQRVDLHSDIAFVQVQAGRYDEAIAEARELQKKRPKDALGFVIEGDILVTQKKWVEAATIYRVALGRSPDLLTANKAVAALKKVEADGTAQGLVAKWLRENPKDLAARLYLADRDMAQKDYKSALPNLRILVELQPNNPVLLNNLAWAGAATGDPKAVQFAERAYRLAPTSPLIMDTYGWLLVERGDLDRGLDLLQQASDLSPGAQEVRLHLARALLKSGKKAAARKELELIVKAPDASTYKDEAAALLKSI
jgi:putative PEP-CTERM system TPR-repeat lipoprotein